MGKVHEEKAQREAGAGPSPRGGVILPDSMRQDEQTADLAAQVAQLRADVAVMGNALADYFFDNGSASATGAKVRAIAERQKPK